MHIADLGKCQAADRRQGDKVGDRRADYVVAWRDELSFNPEHGDDQ